METKITNKSSSMTNRQKLALAVEAKKRKDLTRYEGSFQEFAKEQIRILPKDAGRGFIPLEFNAAQQIVDNAIEKQLKETQRQKQHREHGPSHMYSDVLFPR